MAKHFVLIQHETTTTGEINDNDLDGRNIEEMIGEQIVVTLRDENGRKKEARGELVEVLYSLEPHE